MKTHSDFFPQKQTYRILTKTLSLYELSTLNPAKYNSLTLRLLGTLNPDWKQVENKLLGKFLESYLGIPVSHVEIREKTNHWNKSPEYRLTISSPSKQILEFPQRRRERKNHYGF